MCPSLSRCKIQLLFCYKTPGKISHGNLIATLCVCMCVFVSICVCSFMSISDPRTVAHQASLSIGFVKQEYGVSSPGDLPGPGIEPVSPALVGRSFTTPATWEATLVFPSNPLFWCLCSSNKIQLKPKFLPPGAVSTAMSSRFSTFWAVEMVQDTVQMFPSHFHQLTARAPGGALGSPDMCSLWNHGRFQWCWRGRDFLRYQAELYILMMQIQSITTRSAPKFKNSKGN